MQHFVITTPGELTPGGKDNMKLVKSKKFWVSVSGVVGVVLGTYLGVPEEATMKVAGIVIALVLGQGLADLGKEAK